MFDAKSLLEMLVKGAAAPRAPAQAPQDGLGGLGDLLGKVLGGGAAQSPGDGQRNPAGAPAGGVGGLEDLLRNMLPGGQAGGGASRPHAAPPAGGTAGGPAGMGGLEDLLRNMLPGAQTGSADSGVRQPQSTTPPDNGGSVGGLEDILRRMGGAGVPSAPQMTPGAGRGPAGGGDGAGSGGLLDILGQILGQATQGAKEGAGRIEEATGAGSAARDALGRATGRAPEDILAQVKEWVQNNQMAAGAAAGGLGGLVLGTRTGRSAATSAAKLGALVMIGGLAYKAYQNYAQGKPVLGGVGAGSGVGSSVPAMGFTAAPVGSGFEPVAITNDAAILYIRAMIGAAAADGRIDAREHQQILGGLQQAGFDGEARAFIEHEIQSPATPADLASLVTDAGQAVQVFTAARLAVDVDTQEEHEYLVELAQRLQLDPKLVAHIDAEATNAAIAV